MFILTAKSKWGDLDGSVQDIRSLTFAEKPEWQMVDVGDFTGNGKPDILFQNTVTGVRGFWEMKDTRFNS